MKNSPTYFIHLWLVFSFFFFCETISAQRVRNIDSLEKIIKAQKGNELIESYFRLIDALQTRNPKRGLEFATKTLELAKTSKNDSLIARSYYYYGVSQVASGYNAEATKTFLKTIELIHPLHIYKEESFANSWLAIIYGSLNDWNKSVKFLETCREISFASKDSALIGSALQVSGIMLVDIGQPEAGLEFLKQARTYQIGSSSTFRTNLGFAFLAVGQIDSALYCFNEALPYYEKIMDKNGQVEAYKGLGKTYKAKQDIDNAIKYYEKGLAVVLSMNKYGEDSQIINEALTNLYEEKGDYKNALKYNRLFLEGKDSLDYGKKFAELDGMFDLEKQKMLGEKEKAIQKANADAEAKKQTLLTGFVGGGLVLVLLFSLFLFNRYRITNRQKKIIEEQKLLVDDKNKEILDSIHYAQRIQNSILPNERYIQKILNRLNKK